MVVVVVGVVWVVVLVVLVVLLMWMRQQRGAFGRLADVVGSRLRGRRQLVAPGETAVVEALGQQDNVGYRVVDGQDDLRGPCQPAGTSNGGARATYHGGKDTLQDGAEDVKDIAQQPDDDELYGEAVGIALLELLDDLR